MSGEVSVKDVSVKVVRRLCAAEGYLELGMPDHALVELDSIDDAGPLTPHVNLLRGTSLLAQEHYAEAIEPLRKAVRTVPAPYDRLAWWSLSKCFQHEGLNELNELAELAARFAQSPPTAQSAPGVFVALVALQVPKASKSATH